ARLERFEWERGYKCAKIVYEFTGNLPGEIELGGLRLEKPKSVVRRVVYFAYDLGQVIRMTTTLQVEGTVRQDQFGGGMGGPGGFGGPPGFGRGPGGFGGAEDEGAMRGGRGPRNPAAAGGLSAGVGAGIGAGGGGQTRGGFGGGGAQTGARNILNRFVVEFDMSLNRIF
ncbi:MAG: hypothetical protein NZM28_01570, partial [Fimbriimonadales bacterium]|nr:hypothetical protein [Fimbriimonadales bacterium]